MRSCQVVCIQKLDNKTDRIATFEKVIEEHEAAQKEALKMVYEQLEEAQSDLKYLDEVN